MEQQLIFRDILKTAREKYEREKYTKLISLIPAGSIFSAEISGLTKNILLETDKCYGTINGV